MAYRSTGKIRNEKNVGGRGKPGYRALRWEANMRNDDLTANPDIAVSDALDSADAAVITDRLRAYDLNQTGYHDFSPETFIRRDRASGQYSQIIGVVLSVRQTTPRWCPSGSITNAP